MLDRLLSAAGGQVLGDGRARRSTRCRALKCAARRPFVQKATVAVNSDGAISFTGLVENQPVVVTISNSGALRFNTAQYARIDLPQSFGLENKQLVDKLSGVASALLPALGNKRKLRSKLQRRLSDRIQQLDKLIKKVGYEVNLLASIPNNAATTFKNIRNQQWTVQDLRNARATLGDLQKLVKRGQGLTSEHYKNLLAIEIPSSAPELLVSERGTTKVGNHVHYGETYQVIQDPYKTRQHAHELKQALKSLSDHSPREQLSKVIDKRVGPLRWNYKPPVKAPRGAQVALNGYPLYVTEGPGGVLYLAD